MATGHFFHEITRYAGGENRLTGVLGAVLRQVPELGLELARSWTDERTAPAEVAAATADVREALAAGRTLRSVDTQLRTTAGKTVDLSLRFGHAAAPSADDVHIWVEVKHEAKLSETQLQNYLRDLPRHAALILLAPNVGCLIERRSSHPRYRSGLGRQWVASFGELPRPRRRGRMPREHFYWRSCTPTCTIRA